MKRLFIALTQSLFTLMIVFAANAQEDSLEVVVPSSQEADVRCIVPPAGFEVSTAFNGYLSMPNSAAIIMMQINNANYLKIAEGMTEEWCTANNLKLLSSSTLESDHGVKGRIFKLSFMLEGDEWIRYMVFAGDLEKTLWLNITYPYKLEELIEGEVLKSLKTVNLNPESDEN